MQNRRRSQRVLVAVLGMAALIVTAFGCGSGSGIGSPSGPPVASAPTGLVHYSSNGFSFDYPARWRTLSTGDSEAFVNYVFVVLGTGGWKSGCTFIYASDGTGVGGCTGDAFDVGGDRIVLKIWERGGGPFVPCGMHTAPANATLGSNAVSEVEANGVVTWEIRRPGSDFGMVNNVYIEVHADSAAELASARALVAGFRWDPGTDNLYQCDSPSPA